VFLLTTMLLLLSFLAVPGMDLSTLSTDFGGRRELIQLFNTARLAAGDRLFNLGIIGSDGWIFYSGEQSILDYEHRARLTQAELQHLQQELDRLDADLHQQSRILLVAIPPNKSTVYAQYMPREIPVFRAASRLDDFLAYMKAHGQAHILDLRSALITASQSEDVYYKTDTHWNDTGAYIAYSEIMQTLAADYPVLQPHPLADFRRSYAEETRDLPRLMGMPQVMEGSWHLLPTLRSEGRTRSVPLSERRALQFTINPNPALPSLLIFHDSFYYVGLARFMEPHFSRITAVPNTDDLGIWSTDWIETQRPDIVIIEVTERYLDTLLPLLGSAK